MTTNRERALLDMGFMPDATNKNVLDTIAADLAQIRKMAAFLAEFSHDETEDNA